jgi:hypothetical protein
MLMENFYFKKKAKKKQLISVSAPLGGEFFDIRIL